jgi:hypothetical protein
MSDAALNPLAPHSLPWFIAAPGTTDTLSVMAAVFLTLAILGVGVLYLKIHSLPERSAHAGRKIQFEIVAILGLLSLFTHNHLFWVAALILAFIDIPDFAGPLRSMAASLGRLSGRGADEAAFTDLPPAATPDPGMPAPDAATAPAPTASSPVDEARHA